METSAEFYLFDVDHGQCAALRTPNGRWCIFDAGSRADFSPVEWIVDKWVTHHQRFNPARYRQLAASFKFEKATISHLHGDHITEIALLSKHLKSQSYGLKYIKSDAELRKDIRESNVNLQYYW